MRVHRRRSVRVLGWLVILAGLLQTGCASLQDRQDLLRQLTQAAGWQSYLIDTPAFDIAAAAPSRRSGDGPLVVYLEGDGRAYLNASQASADPTPSSPLALRLALADDRNGKLLYLARPCQYTMPGHGRHCERRYWTSARYAPVIVASIDQAIDQEKQSTHSTRVVLVGYSGGGALAVLVASRRKDVAAIVTVAANLDLDYWTRRDGLERLDQSLDPGDVARQVSTIAQVHFAGAEDDVVGPDVARAFLLRMTDARRARLVMLDGVDHDCCWVARWRGLLHGPEMDEVIKGPAPGRVE
ncbi:alpha/beta fold hydrolase [Herbaspirillum sp. YR522]|uniref:alpha/beta fold hydrolase n=1 Tax=Herbaspirillum sp. YR522 TaxID=1144342 RepID=UPI00026F4B1F|nr:alpha/beta fold hydrolase [Herbaspirillum sp. YR522]EJM97460.1 poly(3-hydroxybutyrate) depolymerase [Herbaspirillum sp. YR522]